MSNTKNTANAAANATAAAVKSTKRTNKTNTNTNAETAANNAPAFPDFTPVQVLETAAAWIKKYGTISAVRADYAALVSDMGKKNYTAVLKQAQTTRAAVIDAALQNVDNWFSGTNVAAAVLNAVSKERAYVELCNHARRDYKGTPAEIAAAIIADYYTNVDNNGAPVSRVSYINAAATEIYAVYELKRVTFSNAVSVLKTALDNMGATAKNAVSRGVDNAAAVRANKRVTGVIVGVYAAALDETDHATIGTRRDNSKDEKTAANAAAVMGKTLPVGCVPVSVWNAAKNGNETAADIVAAAHDAAANAAANAVKSTHKTAANNK